MPVIRQALFSDIDDLALLLKELFSIEADFSFDEDRQRRGLAMMLEDSGTRCIVVAQSGGQAVGMCSAQLVVSTAEGGFSGLVEDMVVRPDYRGSGTGRRLLEAIGQWATERGATRLQLLADRHNAPALDFYEHLGWGMTQLICLHKKDE
ncbi:N-acetyltransferase [Desulfonema ishimotonii]|uniref:N-acetyltransferase n=2 Tax=Desulfonema ishimotonii TaxID=45657 RepID=A0A401FRZ0_9BACT|nr:N-acetyltransferase [Desulfonema ishimotonii]